MTTRIKVILALFILFSGAAAYLYFFVYNKAHENYQTAEAEFCLEAKTLYESFTRDTSAASTLYAGKVIEIDGIIDTIENHGDTLFVAVFIFEQGMFGPQGVRCSFLPNQTETVKMLQPNTAARIKGVCQGYNDTDVIIESASIVEDIQ
jgi:hypothetical protein